MHDLDHDIRVWPLGIGGWSRALAWDCWQGGAVTVRVERIGDATLYLGDCLEILPTLPAITPTAETEPSV